MITVNTTSVFPPGYDLTDAVDRLCRAGFPYIDVAFDYCLTDGHPFLSDDWLGWAKALRKHADEKGAVIYQCHGIGRPEDIYDGKYGLAYRAVDAAAILGVKWLVMHPQELSGMQDEKYDALYVEKNVKWFSPFVEYAEKAGVGVAIENLPWPNCNRIGPLNAIVDGLRSSHVGVCWDTGHANLNGLGPGEMKRLGDRLVTLHIHDNHGNGADEHLIPYYGSYDWEAFIKTLGEMDYKGEFVLEAHHQMLDAFGNEAAQASLLSEMAEVSERIKKLL